MPQSALDLLAAKAKLAGAVVLGGVVATAALSGGALSLVADSSGTTTQVVTSTSAEPTESPKATGTTERAAPADDAKIVLNHATVVSIDTTSLVVTANGATTTWTLGADTRWTGAIKDPAQILPGMVIHLRGTKAGNVYTATHVVTPGKNRAKHEKRIKAAKAAKTHAKKGQGKRG
jgi:hypothetical protein